LAGLVQPRVAAAKNKLKTTQGSDTKTPHCLTKLALKTAKT